MSNVAGKSKIGDFESPVAADEQIFHFDVAVSHTNRVQVLDAVDLFDEVLQDFLSQHFQQLHRRGNLQPIPCASR